AAFRNHLPVRISFGDNTSHQLRELLAGLAATRALLIIDAGLVGFSPAVADTVSNLQGGDITLSIHEKPAGEPTIEMVDSAREAVLRTRPDAIIALGGGSVIDTAKAARLCAQLGTDFRGFLASDRHYPEPTIPLFALPTTAGTGSEVSGGAVIIDQQGGTKSGIASPLLRAQYAIVDPVLTYTTPAATTAFAGVDALAQAIAATIAQARTPIGDGVAFEAIRHISRSLVSAYRDGSNAKARSDMACGSMMAGLAMNISDCTAEHALGQAIGGMFHAAHGLTVGLVLVEVLQREAAVVPEQLDRVADAMQAPAGPTDGSRAVLAVQRILAELEFPVLSSLGVSSDHVDELSQLAMDDFFITQAPAPWTFDEVRNAFESALALEHR
ncbi:MAG: iron-containing alcohol dehydrogenase family protein, partial [Actinomycetales bacterium]